MNTLLFNQQSIEEKGVYMALAEQLFCAGHVTLGRAARIARLSYAQFTEHLSALNIPVVDYPIEDLEDELRVAAL